MAKRSVKQRNLNIEVLRILAMFLIVACHATLHLPWLLHVDSNLDFLPGWKSALAYLVVQYGQVGVSIFFIISGYFLVRKTFTWQRIGAADVFLETERKVSRMFSLEERSRAVELYLTTPMTTAQVVECLGYPTRQCLERWLAMDPRYAGRMAKPIIPLETRRKAIELVLGGMQQKQAAKQLGVSVGAVHNWVRAYRRGGMAALQPRNQNAVF